MTRSQTYNPFETIERRLHRIQKTLAGLSHLTLLRILNIKDPSNHTFHTSQSALHQYYFSG
jgi:hypothetical protein